MLVITRRPTEIIHIGDNITITIVRIGPGAVRLGIDAPTDTRIVRGELKPPSQLGETEND